jgi:selenocysteine lyase/cysteine desulfurase
MIRTVGRRARLLARVAVRASPHYFNTHDELEQLIGFVARLTS